MTVKLSTARRDSMISGISYGTLEIYSGAQPADPNAAPSGTKLVEFANISFSAPSNGQIALANAPYSANALASGAAGWARLTLTTGDHIDMSVGATGADIVISDTAIVSGELISLNALTIAMPAS